MRAFYYLFNTFLITCFQYTSTNVGKNLGGPLMSATYAGEHLHRSVKRKRGSQIAQI